MRRLRDLLATREDPYAGVDLANAGRIGGALWLLGAVVTLVLLPLAPPTAHFGGPAGWMVAAVVVILGVVGGRRLMALGAQLDVDELLAHSYLAIVAIALMVWLSGGVNSPYAQLLVLSALYTSAVHPARRVLPYLVVLVVLALAPLVYDDAGKAEALDFSTEVVVWLALSFVVMATMSFVRSQRLGLRREGETARRQARLDPLTGLLNRRAFDEELALALERARATGEPLSVLVADLDGFKEINDRHGHLEGDRLLRGAADALVHALRRPDIAYRWGGDEFALILAGARVADARHVAERVRVAVAQSRTPAGEPLTMAAGVAEYDEDRHDGPEALLASADRALLAAKGRGVVEA